MPTLMTTEDVFKRIHSLTLERKKELSMYNNMKVEVFSIDMIEKSKYVNFEKMVNLPAMGKSVIFLYQNMLSNIKLLDRSSITPLKVYPLVQFSQLSKVAFIVNDGQMIIDPALINVFCTNEGLLVMILDAEVPNSLMVTMFGSIYSYNRYDSNVNIPIPDKYNKSIMTWTNGTIDWISVTGVPGNYYLPVRPQGTYSLVIVSDNICTYHTAPQTNGVYNYINFPPEVGFEDLQNIFYCNKGDHDFLQPIQHTPMYDGFKVGTDFVTSLELDGSTGYIDMGEYVDHDKFSIHMRLKINSFNDKGVIIQRANGWCMRTTSEGRIMFQTETFSSFSNIQSDILLPGQWYTITVTVNSDGSQPTMYVGAVTQINPLYDDVITSDPGSTLVVGRMSNSNSNYSNIVLDFIKIFNDVLDIDTVKKLVSGEFIGTSLINNWNFIENGGTTVRDSISNQNGTLYGTYIWNKDIIQETDKIVLYVKRSETVPPYADLRHYYGMYRDYMSEYLNETLPPYIQKFTPFQPNITDDTHINTYRNNLVTASRDFPNFLKWYLEEISSFATKEYPFTSIRPSFNRVGQVLNPWDGTMVGDDMPRFVKGDTYKTTGLILEPTWTNINSDPEFTNPIIDTDTPQDNHWVIPVHPNINNDYITDGGILKHTAYNYGSGRIKVFSPNTVVNKMLPLTISFKIKYNRVNTYHEPWAIGTAVDNYSEAMMSLESFKSVDRRDRDGWIYREYCIPAGTFTGSGNSISIGIYGALNIREDVEYFLKEMQFTETTTGMIYTPNGKAIDTMTVPTANLFDPSVGSIEMMFTCKGLHQSEPMVLLQGVSTDIGNRFIIQMQPDGVISFAVNGTIQTNKFVISPVNTIVNRSFNYIALTWENGNVYAYLNGELLGSSTNVIPNIDGQLNIGSSPNRANSANIILHDFRTSKIRRTDAEILNQSRLNMRLSIDEYTTHKLEFTNTLRSPNPFNHPTVIVTNHDLSGRLLFLNGLNISPSVTKFSTTTKKYTSYFRENDIVGPDNKVIEIDTGETYDAYYERKSAKGNTLSFGPSSKIHNGDIELYRIGNNIESNAYNQETHILLNDHEDDTLFYPVSATHQVLKLSTMTLTEIGIQSDPYGDEILAACVSADGNFWIAGRGTRTIRKIDRVTYATIDESPAFPNEILKMISSNDGKLLVVGGVSNSQIIKVNPMDWSVEVFGPQYTGTIMAVTIGNDESVYIGGQGEVNTQRVWRLNGVTLEKEGESTTYGGNITCLLTGNDGSIYVAGTGQQTVKRLSPVSLTSMAESISYGSDIFSIVHGNENDLFVGGVSGNIMKLSLPELTVQSTQESFYNGNINVMAIDRYGFLYIAGASGIPITKYEARSLTISTEGAIQLVESSLYDAILDENVARITLFDPDMVGGNYYLVTKRYNKVITRPYSTAGLIQKMPTWSGFMPKEQHFVFLNGQFLTPERVYLFNPFKYKILKGDTTIVTDLDTDTVNGETLNCWVTSEMIEIGHDMQLSDGDRIITLSDKSVPFSNKYFLIFVNGRLIYPDDIKEIDNYSFSITTDSVVDLRILRKVFRVPHLELFNGVNDKWTEYLSTLSLTDLENLIGPMGIVTAGKDDSRDVFLTERHLFEVLYYYCMKGKRNLTSEDNYYINMELPQVLLPDGRIPISSMRQGLYPRYPL